jgi:hypothetical protein
VKRSARLGKVKVTADGEGVVSHAGAELLREMTGFTGLIDAWDRALISTYKAMPIHFPETVLADLAVAIADGADSISDLKSLRDQPVLFGPVASTSTAWRVLDPVSEAHLSKLLTGRATARRGLGGGSGSRSVARAVPRHRRHHRDRSFLDRTEVSSGEGLAGIVREGRAGSNTTADHISVLTMALAALPEAARPKKGDPEGPRLLVRADAAGATHGFAAFCREEVVAFSFGFAIDKDVRKAIVSLPECARVEATEDAGTVRDGAWVAEITVGLDLSAWPEGSRVIVRKERPPSRRPALPTRSKDCATPPSSGRENHQRDL